MSFLDNMTRSPGLLGDIAHSIQEKDELKRREQMSDVIKGVKSLRNVPDRYQRDEEFVTKCVRARPLAFKDIHPIFKNNASIFRAAMTDNNYLLVLMYAGDKLRADKEFVFDTIGFNRGELNAKYMDDSLKKDKEFVLRLVKHNPMTIQYVSDELRDDDDIASAAISKKGQCIKFCSQRIQSDPKMIAQAVTAKEPLQEKQDWTQNDDTIEAILRKDPLKIRELSKDLQNDHRIIQYAISNASDEWSAAPRWDRDQILSAAERDGLPPFDVTYLKNSSHTEWNAIEQKQLAIAISHTPEVLFRASDKILNDTELLVDAMNRNSQVAIVFNKMYSNNPEKVTDLLSQWVRSEHFDPSIIQFYRISDKLFSSEERACKIVSDNPVVFKYFSDDMRDNRKIAESAITKHGTAFKYASDRLRQDKTLALLALERNSSMLQYVSEELKADKDVVLRTVAHNRFTGHHLQYASDELRKDKEVVLKAVSQDIMAFDYASDELKGDKEFVLEVIEQLPPQSSIRSMLTDELKNDRDIAMATVKKDALELQALPQQFRDSKAVVMAAVMQNGDAIEWATDRLKDDAVCMKTAIRQNINACPFMSDRLKNDKDFVLELASERPDVIKYVSDELRDDKDIMMAVVNKKPALADYASNRLKNDKDFVLAAMKPQQQEEDGPTLLDLARQAVEKTKQQITPEMCSLLFEESDLPTVLDDLTL